MLHTPKNLISFSLTVFIDGDIKSHGKVNYYRYMGYKKNYHIKIIMSEFSGREMSPSSGLYLDIEKGSKSVIENSKLKKSFLL